MAETLRIDERARRDGCDCPSWVIRCAHFDDDVLLLSSKDAGAACPCPVPDGAAVNHVVIRKSILVPCPIDGSPRHTHGVADCYTDNESAANAAFDAAVERLLAEGGAL